MNTCVTYFVTHVIGSEKTEIRFGSMFRITALEVVELGTVCEGIVAVFSRKCKDVDIIGSAGTFRSVWKKESCTAPKEDVNNRAEWSSTDKVFGDDYLIVAIIHVGGKRCRSCVLGKGSIDVNILDTKTDRDPGCDDKTGVISCGFCGFEDGSTRISILINTNGTIVSLGTRSEKQARLESVGFGTLIAQE